MSEKATALVLRATDWSETSRIATLWTKELGKVRVLAKGGRRLKSAFESALDLLTVCSIVLLRKSSGSLDLLTEAQVLERFPKLRSDLQALYSAYYVAELLADWTEDYDPHPALFDEALEALRVFGDNKQGTSLRLARFEIVLLRELGYSPQWENCGSCGTAIDQRKLVFSPSAGGMICNACMARQREKRTLSRGAWLAMRELSDEKDSWQVERSKEIRAEVRQVLGQYITYLMGRRPKLMPYLGS